MKRYSIIILSVLIFCSMYFIFHAAAKPQQAGHDIMCIAFDYTTCNEIYVSNSNGEFEEIKLDKKGHGRWNLSQILMKVKEYENQGWVLKSYATGVVNSYSGNSYFILEK